MKPFLIIVAFLFLGNRGFSQYPWEQLAKWAQQNPVEKIHLHFDRDSYIAGETAWFKAYLSADNLPDTISSNLYVELLDSRLSIVSRKVLPVLLGASSGQIEIPDSLTAGFYTVRAYTPSMLAVSPDFIFRKGVFIYSKKEKKEATVSAQALSLNFFPEGGNLVSGLNNNVAFKATYDNGYPSPVNGAIKNSKGDILTTFNDYHDGMGMFELSPVTGEKYYAEIAMGRFELPLPVEKGIALNVMQHPQGFLYELQQKTDDPLFVAAYMVGHLQHRLVFRQDLKPLASVQGVVSTKNIPSGILQVTFFNKNGMPLAERLWFVNNKEYLLTTEIITDTVDTRTRARNKFRLSMKDTVQGNISVSVVDADYETSLVRDENILTSLLLTSDIKGYVHKPSWYFSGESDSVMMAVDLLMMTNGWRRFKWTDLALQSEKNSTPPAYITLEGRATLRGTNRPFDDKALLLMINSIGNKKKRNTQMLQTDKEGNFLIDSLLFFDRNLLVFSDVRGKKSQYIDITLKGDSLHRYFIWQGFSPVPGKITFTANSKWQMDYDAIQKENGLMLEGVTIKVQKKSPMEQVDEKYSTGMFSGNATKAIDLVNNEEALPYTNIFEYLQNRVNGLQITNDGADYGVFYRQGPSISSMGNIPMTIFLDEIETDVSVVAAVPANQVALVKVYNTFAGAWGNAPGGVLAIYTRKGEDVKYAGRANTQMYNGYSVVKEFYAPDYKLNPKNEKADTRITIDWRPNIFINSINPRLPVSFYNNDRTKKFKVVVEGMTTSGKLIWLEKIISN